MIARGNGGNTERGPGNELFPVALVPVSFPVPRPLFPIFQP